MIIFGTAGFANVLGVMMALCGRCNNHAKHHIVKRGTKFSLFFIPLFPISSYHALECGICGQQRRLTKEEAESLASGQGTQQQMPQQQGYAAGPPQQGYAQGQYPHQPQQGYPQGSQEGHPQQPQQHNPWQNPQA